MTPEKANSKSRSIIYNALIHKDFSRGRELLVLDFIQFMEQRYGVTAADTLPQALTPEQRAAYARLSRLQIDWGGKPITDRDEANAR